MGFHCPACGRAFGEAGFCPFDGRPLTADRARSSGDGPPTEPERRRTFPLGSGPPVTPAPGSLPTVPPGVQSGVIDVPEPPPSRETAAEVSVQPPPAMQSRSALADPSVALRNFQPHKSEYDALVGETLEGRYYVQRKIGEGGMGVVFAARHAVIERPLAIKVLKREVMRDTATIRRFVQEAQAASRTRHPNIVDVTDFGTTPDGMTYSVMEYIEGMTLSAAIKAGAPFSIPRAIRIAAQICRGLGAAHDKGIVHRDLKPENVFLLDRDGRPDFVKIVDFGIAKVTPVDGSEAGPRLTRVGSVFGTPEYMAPEQAAGRSDTDGRVDVYALGIILYEMITGRVPHRSDNTMRTIAMQMLDPIVPPSQAAPQAGITPALEAVMVQALAKKREQRYSTMGELLEALDVVIKDYQSPTGVSVTGSPVYSLSPLPPGADIPADRPPVTPLPIAPDGSPPSQIPATGQRSNSPSQGRRYHEPEFAMAERPSSFDHVFTEETAPLRRRRWPWIVIVLAVIGGGSVAAVELLAARTSGGGEPRPAPPADARVVAIVPPPTPADAALAVRPVASDAGVAIDAATVVVDAGAAVARPDAAVAPLIPHGTVEVRVYTQPDSATVFVDGEYSGVSGVTVAKVGASRHRVECRLPHYRQGQLYVTFDKSKAVICALTRKPMCVNGLKNPYDQCDEPTAPP